MTFIMCQYAPARTVWNSAWLKHWLWTLKCVLLQECMRHCQICRVARYTWIYHMEEITGTLPYIYWSYYHVSIELSGWKGSVSYGLGADISLPHCLATGIWTLAHPKSDLRAEISGSIVRYDALAPRPEVLLFCHFVCACVVSLELKLPYSWGKSIRLSFWRLLSCWSFVFRK